MEIAPRGGVVQFEVGMEIALEGVMQLETGMEVCNGLHAGPGGTP